MTTRVRLVPMRTETSYAPLGVLGYCLTRTGFLKELWRPVELPLKTVDHEPEGKLQDMLVSILAGCRALSQVNTRVRPDVALAQAWGRKQFAEQSTLSRTLDAFEAEELVQLRLGSEALFRRESLTLRHDFAQDWLQLDIDLTPLPCSKQAEWSTKGQLGKKTGMAVNSPVARRRSITKRSCLVFTQVSRKAVPPTCPPSPRWNRCWPSRLRRSNAPSCVPILDLAVTPTSTKC